MQKKGDVLSVLAAVLLVFSPMLNPWITFCAGVAILVGMVVYRARKAMDKPSS